MLGIDRRDRKWKRMVGTKAEERSLHFGREALDVVHLLRKCYFKI
jgi:hypothetical protein